MNTNKNQAENDSVNHKNDRIEVYSYQDAINQSGMDSASKHLLYVILSHASLKTKNSFPSITTLASETSLHRSTIFEKITNLEQNGFIRRFNRKTPKGLTSNCYETILPKRFRLENRPKKTGYYIEEDEGIQIVGSTDPVPPADGIPSPQPTYPVGSTDGELISLTNDSNILKKYIKKGSDEKEEKEALERDYEDFWKTYPRKIGDKKTAFKFYQTARQTVSHETIMAVLKTMLPDMIAKKGTPDEKYIKHPQTWLNAQSWDDQGEINRLLSSPENSYLADIPPEKRIYAEQVMANRHKLEKIRDRQSICKDHEEIASLKKERMILIDANLKLIQEHSLDM